MESPKYLTFCLSDPIFFDTPARMADHGSRFSQSLSPAPEGWRRGEFGLWTVLTAIGTVLPDQGWKVHLSATPDAAAELLDRVWDYCVGRRLAFKFLRSRAAVQAVNAKEASRGSSGKLVTIYLPTADDLATVLPELTERLAGITGPYVLSDLRYGPGPAYVRYGAFTELYCADPDGEPTPALRTPDGDLVPDRRGPVFSLPGWVTVPEIVRGVLAERSSEEPTNFPYDVKRALQFSNGGGIYLAVDRSTGAEVVLREARPLAGLDKYGRDAVARLAVESSALARLSDLDCVPRVLGRHRVWEHEFLAQEYIEGETLLSAVIGRYPLVHPNPTAAELDAYREWGTDVLARVEHAVELINDRGIRFGDLHPGNVIVRPDGRIALVDFELATELDAPGHGLGAPGFTAPAGTAGADIDRHALDCLRLFVFLPLAQMRDRDRAKAGTLTAAAREIFPGAPLPGHASRLGDRAAELFDGVPDWPRIRDSLVAGIHASATPGRTDRLFPGDPDQFVTGGLALRSGAAGVLYALHQVGEPIPDEYTDLLISGARRRRRYLRGGLYDGLYGVATLLHRIGRPDEALEILELARAEPDRTRAVGLLGGAAGIALTLFHFGDLTGSSAYRAEAVRLTDGLAAMLREPAGRTPAKAGLMRGMTGPALLFVRRYEQTGDPAFLDLAASALRIDLGRCVAQPDGTLQIHDGSTYLSYLDDGSAGIALVLHQYLRHRENSDFAYALSQIRTACHAPYVFQPGLFRGRAGLLATLGHLGFAEDRPAVRAHVHRLAWHAVLHDGHLAFPGHGLQRLSMDLATGSAGVLLASRAAFETGAAFLPFLSPEPAVAVASSTPEGGELDVVRA